MPQLPQLWTATGLATELHRDARTIVKALRDTPPDGRVGKHPAWHMANVMKVLTPVEQRYPRSSSGDSAAIDNAEAVWDDLRRAFEHLEGEKDIDHRRVMAQEVAPLIGELEGALNAVWQSADDKLIYGPLRDRLIATAISELARLCKAELRDAPNGRLVMVVP
jgi:hypothetical protein